MDYFLLQNNLVDCSLIQYVDMQVENLGNSLVPIGCEQETYE